MEANKRLNLAIKNLFFLFLFVCVCARVHTHVLVCAHAHENKVLTTIIKEVPEYGNIFITFSVIYLKEKQNTLLLNTARK